MFCGFREKPRKSEYTYNTAESVIRIITAVGQTLSDCLDHAPFSLSSGAIYQFFESYIRYQK